MGKKKMKFEEITNEREILKICYSMWKRSIDEYKNEQIDSRSRSFIGEAMKYRWYHCRLTGEISLEVYDSMCNGARCDDWRILYFAALTHDIKKYDHRHCKVGACWIKDNIRDFLDIKDEEVNAISELISAHKSKINEGYEDKERISILLENLKIGDKLSKEKEKLEYKNT